jgi:hypothetical protein
LEKGKNKIHLKMLYLLKNGTKRKRESGDKFGLIKYISSLLKVNKNSLQFFRRDVLFLFTIEDRSYADKKKY